MPAQVIKISGARQHNLKNIHVELPREKAGCYYRLEWFGKILARFSTTSLCRRTAPLRRKACQLMHGNFSIEWKKPNVDFIQGLSPAIAIEQRSAGANPRSTIATTTEIYDYLRVFFFGGRPAAMIR